MRLVTARLTSITSRRRPIGRSGISLRNLEKAGLSVGHVNDEIQSISGAAGGAAVEKLRRVGRDRCFSRCPDQHRAAGFIRQVLTRARRARLGSHCKRRRSARHHVSAEPGGPISIGRSGDTSPRFLFGCFVAGITFFFGAAFFFGTALFLAIGRHLQGAKCRCKMPVPTVQLELYSYQNLH